MGGLPDHVVGVSASGEVDAKDYETVFIPALDSALKRHNRITVLSDKEKADAEEWITT